MSPFTSSVPAGALLLQALLPFLALEPTLALQANQPESPQLVTSPCDGRPRDRCEVELDVPASCVQADSTSSCPVAFLLHGAGGTNDWFARTSGVHNAGDLIGVYPQGEDGWNTGPKSSNTCQWSDFECTEDPDEGGFFAAVIAELRNMGALGNIYVIGNSNGAALAHRLASNAGDDLPIKGIVTKVTQLLASPTRSGPGVLNYNQPSSAGPRVSVLNVMGTNDGLIPYEGGSSAVFGGDDSFQLMSALDSMEVWAFHNGCDTNPVVTTHSSDMGTGEAIFYKYGSCQDGTIVEHYAVVDGGHDAGGVAIDGRKVDYEIAFDFIRRVEGGGDSPSSPVASPPVASPTPSPEEQPPSCVDDQTWAGKFNDAHTCSTVAEAPDVRCNWVNRDGVPASTACALTCGTCTPVPVASPTSPPVLQTDSLTDAPEIEPTPAPVLDPIVAPTAAPISPPIGNPTVDFTSQWTSAYADGGGTERLIPREEGSIMNYQPAMPTAEDANAPPVDCPHLEGGTVAWNDPNLMWPTTGGGAGPPPADGSDVMLPADTAVIIRAGMLISTNESPYGRITVPQGSRLIFDDTGVGGLAIEMHTLGITVEGALEAGCPTCRIEGNIDIVLHGEYGNLGSNSDRHLSELASSDMGFKGILVSDIAGARWDFHGKLYHPTWTRLAALVPGNTQAETSAPPIRNSEIFLQDCVNWPDGGKIVVTTSHVKDTRGYHFNEEATIASGGIQCVMVDGRSYGKVTLTSPLEHYHHAGAREYQSEVGLLTRNILVRGNDRSDPTDDSPLECASTVSGWTTMPCPGTFLTGFGGHTILVGKAEGRIRGVEFHKMGMTNILGRYPVHFHHNSAGSVSEVADCSVHRSYYRAFTIHNTDYLTVHRNTAYDISGHAYYLEAGTEENNHVEHNLAAFVHVIDGAQLMPSNVVGDKRQSDTILVPADHTASGFYVSNVHNYIVGNAASGGWAGIQFPVLPEPADKSLRGNDAVPKDRPSLLISGNSVHSSSWFAKNSGAVYEGGSLYWDESDDNSETLIYNAGRVSSQRLTRLTKDSDGNDDWFRVYNTTVWLCNIGATGWGKRAEMNGFEVHDFQNRAIFVLFTVWMNSIVINCRTSNAPRVPDPGQGRNENLLNNGRSWSGFFTYDHLMKHILTNWKVSHCGGVARGLDPWVPGGASDTGDAGLVTIPVNGLAPEVQLISSGMEYDWETLGGQGFVNESIFFADSGARDIYSMQYMSNWEDADGSWTVRGNGGSTIMGPAVAGKWWELDYRPGKCEVRDGWKFPQRLCDKDGRQLASMFTVIMPQIGSQGSAVLSMLDPNANARKTRQGSMTHFGLLGDGSSTTCTPPETCGDTTSRSWDPDLTGPFNHTQYGGWYLSFDEGTPIHLTIQKVQIDEGAVMLQAMSVPPGTLSDDVNLWAESRGRAYSYALANTLDEVRAADKGDMYFLDNATNTLYWRVISGYVNSDLTFEWMNREALGYQSFSRGGLAINDYAGKNSFQLHIEISCPTDDITGAFCATKPAFLVPDMGCLEGEVMLAIDQCGPPCELDGDCFNPTASPMVSPTKRPTESPTRSPTKGPTTSPTGSPTSGPTKRPTAPPTKSPTAPPTKSPTESPTRSPTRGPTERPTESPTKMPTESPMKSPTAPPTKRPTESPTRSPTKGPTRSPTGSPTKRPTAPPTASPSTCNVCTDEATQWMTDNGERCHGSRKLAKKCNLNSNWVNDKVCQYSCYMAGMGYEGDECCHSCLECTDEETPWMIDEGLDCETTDYITSSKCKLDTTWTRNKYCELSCYNKGLGYDEAVCCQSCKDSGEYCEASAECCSGSCHGDDTCE